MRDRHEVASDASSVGRWHVSINMCMHGKQTQEDKKMEYCRSTEQVYLGRQLLCLMGLLDPESIPKSPKQIPRPAFNCTHVHVAPGPHLNITVIVSHVCAHC